MANLMPGTVIRFGAEYRRRPVLSLFGPKDRDKDGTLHVADTQIRVQASIEITRGFPATAPIALSEEKTAQDNDDPRGKIIDVIA